MMIDELLKSSGETVWQALSRQECRAFDSFTGLVQTTGSINIEISGAVSDAYVHWQRTACECDIYLDHHPECMSFNSGNGPQIIV
jgi:hypothetical protein